MKKIASEEHKNMTVAVFEENGIYEVKAAKNGRIINTFTTADKYEAQEVYGATIYAMYE